MSFGKPKEIGGDERTKQRTKASFVLSKQLTLSTNTYLAIINVFRATAGAHWTAEESRTLIGFGDSRTCKPN